MFSHTHHPDPNASWCHLASQGDLSTFLSNSKVFEALPATVHSPSGMSTPGAFALGSRPPSRHVSPHLSACFFRASLVTQAPSLLGAPPSACRIPYFLLTTFLPTILSGHSLPPPASWSPVQASLSHHQGPSGESYLDFVPFLPPNPQQLYPATCVRAQKRRPLQSCCHSDPLCPPADTLTLSALHDVPRAQLSSHSPGLLSPLSQAPQPSLTSLL